MRKSRWLGTAVTILAAGVAVPGMAQAQAYNFSFAGPGVGGTLMLTYGAATDSKYPGGYEVTGISGNFSDTNNGLNLNNVMVGSLVPINHATPADPGNYLAPHDFSTFAVASGLPAGDGGVATFDNLFWPMGAPATCVGFPGVGGLFDTYGLMFGIGNGQYVNVWSNGVGNNGAVDYGAMVSTAAMNQDYVGGGITTTTTPEPGTLWLIGTGLVGVAGMLKRKTAA